VLHNFKEISKDLGVEMKNINTITEKWPNQLKLQLGQPGAEEEFRLLLGSGFTNIERYVEWRKDLHGLELTGSGVLSRESEKLSVTKCANCGSLASIRCIGCVDGPQYESGEPIGVAYCNRDCQVTH